MSASFNTGPRAHDQRRPSPPLPLGLPGTQRPPYTPGPQAPAYQSTHHPAHDAHQHYQAHNPDHASHSAHQTHQTHQTHPPPHFRPTEPRQHTSFHTSLRPPSGYAYSDHESRAYATQPGIDYGYAYQRRPPIPHSGAYNHNTRPTLPQTPLHLPPPVPPQQLPLPPRSAELPPLQIPPLLPQGPGLSPIKAPESPRELCASQPVPLPPSSRPSPWQTPAARRPSASARSPLPSFRPSTSESQRSSQASETLGPIVDGPSVDDRIPSSTKSSPTNQPTMGKGRKPLPPILSGITPPDEPMPPPTPTPAPAKPRRVRTGCLTCRERHLKCDEGVPDCLNCRKGSRECKRGVRLNFIELKEPGTTVYYVPADDEWNVSFCDESRDIASEYKGGRERYPKPENSKAAPPAKPPTAPTTATVATAVQAPEVTTPRERRETRKQKYHYRSQAHVPDNYQHASEDTPWVPPAPQYQTQTQTQTQTQQPFVQPPRTNTYPPTWNPATYTTESVPQNHVPRPYQMEPETHASRPHPFCPIKSELVDATSPYHGSDASSVASSMEPQGMGPSSVASFQVEVGDSPTSVDMASGPHDSDNDRGAPANRGLPECLPTPPSEKHGYLRPGGADTGGSASGGLEDGHPRRGNGGEIPYLSHPDEVMYLQVYVEDVGVWLDALDHNLCFGNIVPYLALKSSMMFNAILACGAKHMTLSGNADDDKEEQALVYYDTASAQLNRSLQNPDRDVAECATTAAVLSAYEIMSGKANERTTHFVGARALLRQDCGWNAQTKGIGAACFWLSIGTEVLRCLEFNWETSLDPDDWGLRSTAEFDLEIGGSSCSQNASTAQEKQAAETTPSKQLHGTTFEAVDAITDASCEETWVHRIFYILAKIVNFRAGRTRYQDPSPQAEHVREINRIRDWEKIMSLCEVWNKNSPRSMHPFSYVLPQPGRPSASHFPNIWLIKRAAIVGRMLYHTAMLLLLQIDPSIIDLPPGQAKAELLQQHHAHQVCGIAAHTKDRGVAGVTIQCLAVSGQVLKTAGEQDEVVDLLKRLSRESRRCVDKIFVELQQAWGRYIRREENTPCSSATAMATGRSADLPSPVAILKSLGPASGPSGLTPVIESTPQHAGFSSMAGHSQHKTASAYASADQMSRSRHLRMMSTTSSVTASGHSGSGASPHSSPMMAPAPRDPTTNPLANAYYGRPDFPYKAFYRPPNNAEECAVVE